MLYSSLKRFILHPLTDEGSFPTNQRLFLNYLRLSFNRSNTVSYRNEVYLSTNQGILSCLLNTLFNQSLTFVNGQKTLAKPIKGYFPMGGRFLLNESQIFHQPMKTLFNQS